MPNLPRNLSPKRRGTLLEQLRSLAERSGSVIGEAYALATRTVLNGVEHLDDLNAERRFRQRARPGRSVKAAAPRRTISPGASAS